MQNTPTQEENTATDRRIYLSPRADIHGNAEGTTVILDLPGVSNDGLEITVEDQLLTIIARKKAPANSGDLVHNEIRPVDYRRVFELAPSIDTTRVTAGLQDGVLTLQLPTAERVKPRRIAVA